MRHCFNILARKSADILAWSITRSTRRPGGTPGKPWWGYAARSSKSGHYFRPKNVIFVTRFQTWPLKSIPVFRPGVSTSQNATYMFTYNRNYVIIGEIRMPTKRFLKIHFLQGPQGAYGSRAPASQKQGSGAPSKVDRAPGLQLLLLLLLLSKFKSWWILSYLSVNKFNTLTQSVNRRL